MCSLFSLTLGKPRPSTGVFWALQALSVQEGVRQEEMLLNSVNRDMFKPFRSHRGLLGETFARVCEDLYRL